MKDTDGEEAKHLKEEIGKLQHHVEEQKKALLEAEKFAKKKQKRLRRESLVRQKADLLNQSNALRSPQLVQHGSRQSSATADNRAHLKLKQLGLQQNNSSKILRAMKIMQKDLP